MLGPRAPLLVALVLVGGPALAQPQSGNTAAAQALFDDGKNLMKAGKYDEACPKLEESQRLDPGGGTLLALALCYEDQGRTASAWAEWNLALSDSRSTHRADRERLALDHIQSLESRVPRVRVVVATKIEGFEVRRDGVTIADVLWNTALPVDPGEHAFEARAPGYKPWRTVVTVRADHSTSDVAVPALELDPSAPPAVVQPPPPPPPAPSAAPLPPPPPPPPPAPPPPPPSSSSLRPWAYIAGGVGVVSAAVGAGFGLAASSGWNDAHGQCPGNKCTSASAVNEGTSAGHAADASSVFFTVGVVGVGAGVVLYLLSGRHDAPAPSTGAVHVTPLAGSINGLAVQGAL